jgi:UDP-N-acetylglucosamine acyltransferase
LIDRSARIHPDAVIGEEVSIGPWSVVDAGVEIGARTWIGPHVVIRGSTRIGRDNKIYPFCSIGDEPQDKNFDASGESSLEIGDGNTIREYCSINRGTGHGGGATTVGDDNWIMAYCHIAHDCHVGNHTVFANNSTLAGHVEIHDHVTLGGFTGVHQFCRMGESSFSAISTIVVKDVPPFVMVDGNTARARAINRVGLKRRGFSDDAIMALKKAYKMLYRNGLTLAEARGQLEVLAGQHPEIKQMLEFINASDRGIVR